MSISPFPFLSSHTKSPIVAGLYTPASIFSLLPESINVSKPEIPVESTLLFLSLSLLLNHVGLKPDKVENFTLYLFAFTFANLYNPF